jgi:hypothetical protein
LVDDRLAQLDAFAADVNVAWAFHQGADVAVRLTAKRAEGIAVAARGAGGGLRPPVPPPVVFMVMKAPEVDLAEFYVFGGFNASEL